MRGSLSPLVGRPRGNRIQLILCVHRPHLTRAGETVAKLSRVVVDVARREVVEIRGPVPHSVGRDALFGLAVGSAVFGGLTAGMCSAHGGPDGGPGCAGEVAAAAVIRGGLMAGLGAAGGAIGNVFHPKKGVRYRAPAVVEDGRVATGGPQPAEPR